MMCPYCDGTGTVTMSKGVYILTISWDDENNATAPSSLDLETSRFFKNLNFWRLLIRVPL